MKDEKYIMPNQMPGDGINLNQTPIPKEEKYLNQAPIPKEEKYLNPETDLMKDIPEGCYINEFGEIVREGKRR